IFHKMIEIQFETGIKAIPTDNGTEYPNIVFREFLKSQGIVHQRTCVNTPAQIGVAERKNWHLLEVARSLLFTMNVPKYMCGEAVLCATYLINRMHLPSLNNRAPLQILRGDSKFLVPPKVFGC